MKFTNWTNPTGMVVELDLVDDTGRKIRFDPGQTRTLPSELNRTIQLWKCAVCRGWTCNDSRHVEKLVGGVGLTLVKSEYVPAKKQITPEERDARIAEYTMRWLNEADRMGDPSFAHLNVNWDPGKVVVLIRDYRGRLRIDYIRVRYPSDLTIVGVSCDNPEVAFVWPERTLAQINAEGVARWEAAKAS